MSKRRRESTSSSSSGESDNAEGYGGAKVFGQLPLANGNELCSAVSEQKEASPVASISTQLRGVIVKVEPEENEVHEIIVKEELDLVESEVEDTDFITSPQLRIDNSYSCSATSTGQQSIPEERRKRVSSKVQTISVASQQPRPSKKVPALKPNEKFVEGSVVMGWLDLPGNPFYPGMIRKATPDEDKEHPGYTRNQCGKLLLFVQFFSDPTTLHWRAAGNLRLFDAAKPYKFSYRHPDDVAEFQKGVRIAKEALSFSAEARLAKYTLPQDATIDTLLNEVENDQQTPRDDDDTPPTGGLLSSHAHHNDSVAHDEDGPAQSNRKSSTVVVAGLKKQAELLETTDREKDGVIKALTEDNSKLTEELKKVKNTNRDLTQHLRSKDELIADLRVKLARTDKEKLEYLEELEKMRSEVESLKGVFDK